MFSQPDVVETVDFGLNDAVSRTEKELHSDKNGFIHPDMTVAESDGVCLVPHPIDLLYYMELKQEEEQEARSQATERSRKGYSTKKGLLGHKGKNRHLKGRAGKADRSSAYALQTRSAPSLPPGSDRPHYRTTSNQEQEAENPPGRKSTCSSRPDKDKYPEAELDPDEDWKNVYKQALDPELQSLLKIPTNLPSIPASPNGKVGSRVGSQGSVVVPPLPWKQAQAKEKEAHRRDPGSLPKLQPSSNPTSTRKKSVQPVPSPIPQIKAKKGTVHVMTRMENSQHKRLPGGSLASNDSLGSLQSVLSLCSDAPPEEYYEKADQLLSSPLLMTVLKSPQFQEACKQTGIDYGDLKKRCKNLTSDVQLDPISLEALAYALQEMEYCADDMEQSRAHNDQKEKIYLQKKLEETQSIASNEKENSSTKINRAWSAVEKANKLIEDRRAEIQKRMEAREKRCKEMEDRKARERVEREEQVTEHMRIVKERQMQKRKADEKLLVQLEKQVQDNNDRIERQVENANRMRLEKTVERSNIRNEKTQKAQRYVESREQERRQYFEEKIARKEEGSQRTQQYKHYEHEEKKLLNQTKAAQLNWHAERRRRALQNQKLEKLGDIKDKHKFLQYNQRLHEALLKERNARQKEEISEIHAQIDIREAMVMNVSPGPGEYGDFSIGKRKKLIKGGVFTRETSTSFLKNALSADALLSPGPGHYFNLQVNLPEGGSFGTAKPKTALEWEIYRASKIPGPADYLLPEKKIHGGKFSPDEISKREIDRVMAHAAQLPGPADYAPEEYEGPQGKSLNEIAQKLERTYLS